MVVGPKKVHATTESPQEKVHTTTESRQNDCGYTPVGALPPLSAPATSCGAKNVMPPPLCDRNHQASTHLSVSHVVVGRCLGGVLDVRVPAMLPNEHTHTHAEKGRAKHYQTKVNQVKWYRVEDEHCKQKGPATSLITSSNIIILSFVFLVRSRDLCSRFPPRETNKKNQLTTQVFMAREKAEEKTRCHSLLKSILHVKSYKNNALLFHVTCFLSQ